MAGLAPQLVSGSSSSEGTPQSTLGRGRFVDVGIFLFAAILIALAGWSSYHAELRHDQYQLILLGKTVVDGGRLYVDCWENKPPGIAWINALGLMIWRNGAIGPWLLPGPLVMVALGLFYGAARRRIGITAARGGVLLGALVYSIRTFDTPSINPDFYASVLEWIAVSLWMGCEHGTPNQTGTIKRRGVFAFLAGLTWAAATSVKQVAWVGLFSLTIVHALTRGFDRKRDGEVGTPNLLISSLVTTGLGFALGLGVVAGMLASQGVLAEAWYAIFTFNTELAGASALRYGWNQLGRLTIDLAPLALPVWLAIVGFCTSGFRRRAGGLNSLFAWTLILWWILATAFALLGPSRSMRYWQATFPPVLWLAVIGCESLAELLRRVAAELRVALVVLLLTIVGLLGRPLWDELRYGVSSTIVEMEKGSKERESLRSMGEQIQSLSEPDERVLALGYYPGIYLFADRRPACRFNGPRATAQMEEILAAIESSRANLILVPPDPERVLGAYCDGPCIQRLHQALERCLPVDEAGGFRVIRCQSEGAQTEQAP